MLFSCLAIGVCPPILISSLKVVYTCLGHGLPLVRILWKSELGVSWTKVPSLRPVPIKNTNGDTTKFWVSEFCFVVCFSFLATHKACEFPRPKIKLAPQQRPGVLRGAGGGGGGGFFFFWLPPGPEQVGGRGQIGATAAGLHHSPSTAGSQRHL